MVQNCAARSIDDAHMKSKDGQGRSPPPSPNRSNTHQPVTLPLPPGRTAQKPPPPKPPPPSCPRHLLQPSATLFLKNPACLDIETSRRAGHCGTHRYPPGSRKARFSFCLERANSSTIKKGEMSFYFLGRTAVRHRFHHHHFLLTQLRQFFLLSVPISKSTITLECAVTPILKMVFHSIYNSFPMMLTVKQRDANETPPYNSWILHRAADAMRDGVGGKLFSGSRCKLRSTSSVIIVIRRRRFCVLQR